MNCASCGHHLRDHSCTVSLPGMFPACSQVKPNGWDQCDCKVFVMPREEPKPKLCVCGHPATSHCAVAYVDNWHDTIGPYWRLTGPCNQGPEVLCGCLGFRRPLEYAEVRSAVGGYEDILPWKLRDERDEARRALETLRAAVESMRPSGPSLDDWTKLLRAYEATRPSWTRSE